MQVQQVPTSQRQVAQQKYKTARVNLLLMIVLTLLNIVLFFAGAESMMLFSATVPFYAVIFGYISALDLYLYASVVFAALCLLAYFLCWLFSKNHYGWMIAALVLFSLDSLALVGMMLLMEDISGILDILIHGYVLYYLILGVKNGHDLNTLPEDVVGAPAATPDNTSPYAVPMNNTTYLRRADTEIKHRVFLEAEAEGCRICYRRVKKVNELVINGYVYAELEMLIETPHELNATFNDHQITAGYNGSMSYIRVDGKQIAQKVRWY